MGPEGQADIRTWIDNIELQMAELLSRRSQLYWLTAFRLKTPALHGLARHDYFMALWMTQIVMTLAALHYGQSGDANDETFWRAEQDFELSDFSDDEVESILDIFGCAEGIVLLEELHGQLGWESQVSVMVDQKIVCDNPQPQRDLLDLYLRRRFADTSFPGGSGLLTDTPLFGDELVDEIRARSHDRFVGAVPATADQGAPLVAFSPILYAPLTFREHLTGHSSQVEELYGVSGEELLAFLHASNLERLFVRTHHGSGVLPRSFEESLEPLKRTGLTVTPKDLWVEQMCELFTNLMEETAFTIRPDQAAKAVNALLNSCSVGPGNFDTVSLDVTGPWPFLYRLGDLVVTDYCMVPNCLGGIVRAIALHPKVRQLRGELVEKVQMRSYLVGALRKKNVAFSEWLIPNSRNELKRHDGSVVAQLDIPIEVGPVLFVIDAKSWSTSEEFERHTCRGIENRWSYIKGWGNKAFKTANKLKAEPAGANYEMSPGIRYVVPLICSYRPEPICEPSERYFVTADIPRVLTPREIVELLSSLGEHELRNETSTLLRTAVKL